MRYKGKGAALAVLFCLVLTACVSGGPAGSPDPSQSVSPPAAAKAAYSKSDAETLLGSGVFSEAPELLDADIACALLGVDIDLVSECAVYLPTSTNAEALALFVLKDAGDAQDVREACEKWVADQIEAYRGYGPEHIPKLEGAVLSVRENSVLLVVGADPGAARTAVDDLDH